jgi:UDP-GlcNAc:undecaprenyl-phosphate GlcNAc-1-phosphate transferase
MLEFLFGAFVPAFILCAILIPLARRLALATHLVAAVRPDRLHKEVRPYGGGLAIAVVLILFYIIAILAPWVFGITDTPTLVRLGIGAVFFFILGMIDDRYALPAAPKLLLQLAGAALVVVGLEISATVWLTAPHAGEAVSILWIVAVVNAYNMLDHADGLAAAVGTLALVALAVGQMTDQRLVPAIAFVTAGALAAFLTANFPPAKLFMGDAGSSLVGYLLGALTIVGQYYFPDRTPSRWVVLIPLAILAVPLFDMVCVVAGRLVRGQNPMVGDATSHLAHRMLARGVGPRTVVLFAAAMAALTGAASVIMYCVQGWALLAAWGTVAAALAMMLIARRRPRPEAAR